MDRSAGPGRGKKIPDDQESFMSYLKKIKLDKEAARSAQRIGTLPPGPGKVGGAIRTDVESFLGYIKRIGLTWKDGQANPRKAALCAP